MSQPRLLHVVVGHQLPTYFINAVRSVRLCAPGDDVLVIDNGSGSNRLRHALTDLSEIDNRVHVIERDVNDLAINGKVGSLYDAYTLAFQFASERRYELIHLIQGDMQMLWWDERVTMAAQAIYERFDTCVNIYTVALTRDRHRAGDVRPVDKSLMELSAYGLTDTGLYHLGRWNERGMHFGRSEAGHAAKYRDAGLRVICHPWASVAPIPWPAVVRGDRVRGREVVPIHPLLLRPLGPVEVDELRARGDLVALEDVCVPWGWACLTPMWPTGVESIDYFVFRWRDLVRGRRSAWPRWDRRGVDPSAARRAQRRPGLAELFAALPARDLQRRRVTGQD